MPDIGPEPELDDDLQPVWNAWHELSEGRAIGMAASGLAYSELSRWCEDNGVVGEERRRWCTLMRAMDREFLAMVNTKKGGADANSRAADRRDGDAARGGAGEAGPRRHLRGGKPD
jgi:hypothetical protein